MNELSFEEMKQLILIKSRLPVYIFLSNTYIIYREKPTICIGGDTPKDEITNLISRIVQ